MNKALVHIYTGEGKGKTTASVGLAVRAVGSGKRILFVQFFKPESDFSGEKDVLRKLNGVKVVRSEFRHPFFTGGKTDEEALKNSVSELFANTYEMAVSGDYDLVIMDELIGAVSGGYLSVDKVIELIDKRPEDVELVMTGRDAPVELTKRADYVTEMLKIKHPFDEGQKARKGIEF
ncbi:MAG: cob(I)yrinic acid a,c-diamide adenosyltransferase [Deltaproteobacteria bacterium]|nr:cob(I)yrinic acid a,c-diamide adenosyltransferase [Deltaproteobacteria bacterium]